MNTRTISIRLPEEMIERITKKCGEKGCCRNEYVKSIINKDLNTAQATNWKVVWE